MQVTTNWINDYLQEKISSKEVGDLLTGAGFPLEETEELPDGDCLQDFEMTSNRGDCTCHVGLAREIAACSDNTLVEPTFTCDEAGPPIKSVTSVTNEEPDLCPLYSARVIQNITVKDSPDWLKTKIANRGDVPRNAVVDATNFVLFEIGQPTHVFDLDKLAGGCIIVRRAKDGEAFLPLGEDATPLKLTTDDLVIADAEKPVALAGVKGGAESAVTSKTKNILIESATFDPVCVRESSRRHKISSDSSFRFERGVSPIQIDPASRRLSSLILELSGGTLCKGALEAGNALPKQIEVSMNTQSCRERLGVEISDESMKEHLEKLGFGVKLVDGKITCTVPYFRGDIHREIDLIEEVGRVYGFDRIPVEDQIEIQVPPFGGEGDGRKAVLDALAGMGFVECTTHSLISVDGAESFLQDGQSLLLLDDDNTAGHPALRPSIIPSLLTVRKHNADNGIESLHLAELGSSFSLEGDTHCEKTELAIIMDANEKDGIGAIRGVVDRICEVLTGSRGVSVSPTEQSPWLEPSGEIFLDAQPIGFIGRLTPQLQNKWDLPHCVHVAQLYLGELLCAFPPEIQATPLPTQPAIERDISIIVSEDVLFESVYQTIDSLKLDHIEVISYVTTYRDKKIGDGKKSLTLRLCFRNPSKTLKHSEVNDQVDQATQSLVSAFGAEIRS